MQLDAIVRELDALFGVERVAHDDWSAAFAHAFGGDESWRGEVEPGFADRWNGLVVRGGAEVVRAATCVFPSDELVAGLEPGTLVFSEHPLAFADRTGFAPLDYAALRARGCSLYAVHVPLYQHPQLGTSLLLARGLGLEDVELAHPLEPALPGGILALGESALPVDGLANRARAFLGAHVPVHVLTRTAPQSGRVAVVAGGGARAELLEAALAHGCRTYVTGNAATNSEVERVQERVRAFRALADAEHVSLVDVTHYGSERASQLAMAERLTALGLPAAFVETGPR